MSSRWVPFFMFFFFGLGVLVILLNYLPGSPGLAQVVDLVHLPKPGGNAYLLSGLGLIVVGFVFATRLK